MLSVFNGFLNISEFRSKNGKRAYIILLSNNKRSEILWVSENELEEINKVINELLGT